MGVSWPLTFRHALEYLAVFDVHVRQEGRASIEIHIWDDLTRW